jgi:WhiB family redox-sensing transcriptional regulator
MSNTVHTPGHRYAIHNHVEHEWKNRAAGLNADPELFFPTRSPGKPSRPYRDAVRHVQTNYCDPCPVRTQCLTFALQLDIRFGVFGGVPEDNRPNGGKQ